MNSSHRFLLVCLIALAVALASCQGATPQPAATSEAAVVPTLEPSATTAPTDMPEPTATPQPMATATPEPTATPVPAAPIAGWEKFEGGGVELWLPESYEGGDLSQDVDLIANNLRSMGPDFEQMAQIIEQNPTMYVIWAYDSDVGASGFLTNVNITTQKVLSAIAIETYMDAVVTQLPEQFQVVEQDVVTLGEYEAGRLVIELDTGVVVAKEVLYAVQDGDTLWNITYATGLDEFDERLPEFESSALTFKLQP